MSDAILVSEFQALAPKHVLAQEQALEWLCDAHTRAQASYAAHHDEQFDECSFRRDMHRAISRYGCSSSRIETRGVELSDCSHRNWEEMVVYDLLKYPEGKAMNARVECYSALALAGFERLYEGTEPAPTDLLHVTCTGYQSPSAAQLLVSNKSWGARTRVAHLYHMGCYASLPALRVASGLVHSSFGPESPVGNRVDVVHTEICSLHMNPLLHTPEQLVVQSLFADGIIRYSLTRAVPRYAKKAFRIGALLEHIVPNSANCMMWVPSHWGMLMTLTRDVPDRLSECLENFVHELCQRANLTNTEREMSRYAVHPGGPKILDLVAQQLHLSPDQMTHSRKILLTRGNMSSATLPHIWNDILDDEQVTDGEVVVSLAFGPGLTISGAVMRKELS
ncbi:MAG TPA: 3-oxoacyl-[acyl-carrier-protein] synthase III C-terminal domain-containing protein [Polyangiaceae bacterium]